MAQNSGALWVMDVCGGRKHKTVLMEHSATQRQKEV